MKVVFVLYQNDNKANGGITSILEVITRLKKIEPVIVTQINTEATNLLKEKGYNVYIINTVFNDTFFGKLFDALIFNLKILGILIKEKANVVHANDIQSLTYSLLSAKLKRASLVFNIRGVFTPERVYGDKWNLVRFCDCIIVLSNSMKKRLARRLPLSTKKAEKIIKPIYSIVDSEIFFPAKSEKRKIRELLSLKEHTFVLLYTAAFSDLKNQLTFIREVIPQLKKTLFDFKVCFVGDFRPDKNEYDKKCQEALSTFELRDHIHFEGYSDKIEKWYQAADVTILASRREGMARCMIESLACGTPVISFDVASAREILEHHKCGFVQKQGEYEAMAENILYLEKNPEMREKMGLNGIETARKLFQAEEIVRQYEEVYFSLKRSMANQ